METGDRPLKRNRRAARCRAALLLLLPALGGLPLGAELRQGSVLRLDGTHNHGRWHCEAREFAGAFRADMTREALRAALARADAGDAAGAGGESAWPSLPPHAQLRVPVKGFDCGNPKMERDLRRSLRAKEFPLILFDLHGVSSARTRGAGDYAVEIEGALRLAGVERSVTLALKIVRAGPDRYRVTAALPVKMTDFEIAPPVALFGLIRASDELTINFDLALAIAGDD